MNSFHPSNSQGSIYWLLTPAILIWHNYTLCIKLEIILDTLPSGAHTDT